MYEISLPTRIVFGTRTSERISEEISNTGKPFPSNTLIVSTGDTWCAEHLKGLRARLLRRGCRRVDIFDRIVPNPDRNCLRLCIESCHAAHMDAIVSFGGGSSMDVAKVAAQEAGVDLLVNVPTTAGTGSEISPWAVITDEKMGEKVSRRGKTPDLAILDPGLTVTMPPALTLYSGLDAFAHALEAYVSKDAHGVTDALSLHSMRLITENLPLAVEDGSGVESRSRMLEGSLLAGLAMMYAGLGLIHAIANTVGGMYHEFPHGLIIANILEEVLRYNITAVPADKSGEVENYSRMIRDMVDGTIGRMVSIPELPLHERDIPLLAERSAANINAATNPRDFTPEDIENIIGESFEIR